MEAQQWPRRLLGSAGWRKPGGGGRPAQRQGVGLARALAALLLAFVWQGVRICFRSGDYSVHAVLLARAACVGLLLLILHSAVDYPLRTTAISAMAGLLAGFLLLPESERIAEPDARGKLVEVAA